MAGHYLQVRLLHPVQNKRLMAGLAYFVYPIVHSLLFVWFTLSCAKLAANARALLMQVVYRHAVSRRLQVYITTYKSQSGYIHRLLKIWEVVPYPAI